MPKKKTYTVELHYVAKYSCRVSVEAESAKKARSIVVNEFNNAELLYDKTTDCPDDASLTLVFVKESHPGSVQMHIRETSN